MAGIRSLLCIGGEAEQKWAKRDGKINRDIKSLGKGAKRDGKRNRDIKSLQE